MDAQEYIYQHVPGRCPTEAETAGVVEWCIEWVADTFGDEMAVMEDGVPVSALSTMQILRGCETYIEGGLEFVLYDVRSIAAATALEAR